MKSEEVVYRKILKDVKKFLSKNSPKKIFYYEDDDGDVLEASFDKAPTRDEFESILIYLNKDKIAQA